MAAGCLTEHRTVTEKMGVDAAAVANEVHTAYDDAAAGSDPVAATDLSQEDERQLAAPEAAVRSVAEPCAAVSSGTSIAAQETDDQLGADAADTLAEEEPVVAISAENDSMAAVHDAAEAEAPGIHEDAATASAPVWPEEHFDRFRHDDGDDDGLESDAGAADMDDSRPPSSVVSPQHSFSRRQLPEPDFWGPARSGLLDVSQHALGALPAVYCWATGCRHQPWRIHQPHRMWQRLMHSMLLLVQGHTA